MQNPTVNMYLDSNGVEVAVAAATPMPIVGPSGASANQVQGNVASGSADSGNPVKVGGVFNTTPPTLTTGQRGDLQLDSSGNARVSLCGPGSTASPVVYTPVDGDTQSRQSLLVVARQQIFNGTTTDRVAKASSTSRIVSSAATTNATSGKASAGTVYTLEALNTSAAVKYLKLYNKASAPTVGTDTPVRTIALPPSNVRTFIEFPTGLYFSTGIAYALTGAAADADTTALAAGDVVGLNIDYS